MKVRLRMKIPKIEKMQIAYNRVKRDSKISYIVIYDTQKKSKGADALAHFKYFNSVNRNSSADFFVDDKRILQINDYKIYNTWHVGDGKGKYGVTNKNSIGIEICVNSDGDYKSAFKNAVWLTKMLIRELSIPIENVIRHYDASKKICPASMSGNNWEKWEEFKSMLKENDMEKFNDIGDNFAKKDIEELYEMGIISGVTETEFKPDEVATRAQIARVARNIIRYITGE